MKKLFIWICAVCFFVAPVNAAEFPALTGRVVDEVGVFSQEQEKKLDEILQRAEPHQVIAVVLQDLRGMEIEDYGVALGRHWGIGSRENNDGVLILIAPNDKRMRIEVGYGLEGVLTDNRSSRIIRHVMLPLAKAEKYAESMIKGAESVIAVLNNETEAVSDEPMSATNANAVTGAKTGNVSEQMDGVFSIAGWLFNILVVFGFVRRVVGKEFQSDSSMNRMMFFGENVILNSLVAGLSSMLISCFWSNTTAIVYIFLFMLAFINYFNWKRWRENPQFPYKKQWHIGTGIGGGSGRSSGGGGGVSGGGGSFGGGGASGRW